MSEPESMRNMLERPISQLEALAHGLFTSLASGNTPEPPIAELAACDANLAEALQLARIHLLKQKQIEQLMDEIHELDRQLVDIVETLATGQRDLQAIIEEGEERIASADKAEKMAVEYPLLISYGSKLADFTAAPPNAPADDKEPAALPYAFHPPFPATEIMQRGRLGLEEPIGPVGETRVIGDTKGLPFIQAPAQARPHPTAQAVQQPRRRAAPNMDLFDLDLNPDL
ncbi:SubName: Full=Uncharacterized protein {ECO:0000313/EMBL:CCA69071.1} [Serendipita indica DSM 11827]|nr:SubName: Full=Uncharacterized protein {ECO:0000313/EMBL:CCA69071.1} [Serendipita indica DSM 11827]